MIVDAGLSADSPDNSYFSQALNNNALLLSTQNPNMTDGILTTHVWPNQTVFLDWFSQNSKTIWAQGLKDLYNLVPYDGLWLDMNEATGFCNGECP